MRGCLAWIIEVGNYMYVCCVSGPAAASQAQIPAYNKLPPNAAQTSPRAPYAVPHNAQLFQPPPPVSSMPSAIQQPPVASSTNHASSSSIPSHQPVIHPAATRDVTRAGQGQLKWFEEGSLWQLPDVYGMVLEACFR